MQSNGCGIGQHHGTSENGAKPTAAAHLIDPSDNGWGPRWNPQLHIRQDDRP
jgi:hypothetical protein